MSTRTAKGTTEDITWLMQDAGLDRAPGFKVQTKTVKNALVTVVYDVSADRAREALSVWAENHPLAVFENRVFDGFLSITQPKEEQ